jgi:hypothetical protein
VGRFPEIVAKTIKPFQGLKQTEWGDLVHDYRGVAKTIKPFQGLKRFGRTCNPADGTGRENHQTLSGIETLKSDPFA